MAATLYVISSKGWFFFDSMQISIENHQMRSDDLRFQVCVRCECQIASLSLTLILTYIFVYFCLIFVLSFVTIDYTSRISPESMFIFLLLSDTKPKIQQFNLIVNWSQDLCLMQEKYRLVSNVLKKKRYACVSKWKNSIVHREQMESTIFNWPFREAQRYFFVKT